MLKLKKNISSVIFDWIIFLILFYSITDNLLIILYLSKTYNLFSHIFVLILGFLMAIKFISIYTIIYPKEIYLDEKKIILKNFMTKKEIFLKDITVHYSKKILLSVYKIHYNNDAAFISKIRYRNHEIFITELNKRVYKAKDLVTALSNS